MAEEYYNIGPEVRNIDFYIGGINAIAVLSSDVSLSATGTIIKYGQSSQSIDVSTLQSGNPPIRIVSVSSSQSIELSKFTVSSEILHILVDVDINLSSSFNANKTTFASSSIAISSNQTTTASKTTFASSQSDIDLSSLITPIKIANADVTSMSINISSTLVVKEILFSTAALSILSGLTANPPIRYSPSYVDSESIITLLIIDNKPLTNHNRTIDASSSPVYIENVNWNNKKSRYYKRSGSSSKKTFNLSWRFLPNYKEKTVDNRYGRDFINSLAEDPDVHILKIINQDASGVTPTTENTHYVFVRNYSETLIRRDLTDDVYYFDCNLVLEEA